MSPELPIPFFKKGGPIDALIVPGEIDGAIVKQNKDRVLAESFPALTPAVGMTFNGGLLRDFNIDMQNTMKTRKGEEVFWPRQKEDWLHGDVREVAFAYVFPVFKQFIALGGLDK